MNTQQILDRARLWADYYAQVQAQRALVRLDAERALDALKARLVPVTSGDDVAWRVLPVGPGDVDALRAISAAVTLAPVSTEAADATRQLEHDVPEALADVDAVAGAKRVLARPAAREAADDAVEFLTEYVSWGEEEGLVATLKAMEPRTQADAVTAADALAPTSGSARSGARSASPRWSRLRPVRPRPPPHPMPAHPTSPRCAPRSPSTARPTSPSSRRRLEPRPTCSRHCAADRPVARTGPRPPSDHRPAAARPPAGRRSTAHP
ncbi:hypothetical protein ET495_16100 [Xylanimonas allomyrinae]|uniref:Uncharacterized protein n=1 Tax=Xylanimonas allomyrinae TaxID=2509459 RepID=A0A4P6ERF0_9MICO|nr:hypothetical protein [Xylanimonas allomyrinae]QAY64483.1 hypothetical protein ET495_16100 [Xylanimonas allomyrinae]